MLWQYLSSYRIRTMWVFTFLLTGIGVVTFFLITHVKSEYQSGIHANNEPIIGILAQESYSVDKYFPPGKYHSYIAASYVKYAESGGARVVPIMIGKDRVYYETIVDRVNGIIFPGGATWFNESNGYADAGVLLYKLAQDKQLPIFGICLGMELLTYADANATEHRTHCDSYRQALPIELTGDFRQSKMFKDAPDDLISIMRTEAVTVHFHRFCVTKQNLTKLSIDNNWHVLSENKDVNDVTFISTLESRHHPFFGVQFHPEKNIFEWKAGQNIPHTRNAIRVSQYFMDVFMNETRLNANRFPADILSTQLIYNYPIHYTGINGSSYEQMYMFS